MAIGDRDKLNRIEELKSKLFSKDFQTKIEHRDNFSHHKKNAVPDGWGDGENSATSSIQYSDHFFLKTSIFKNFFIFSIVFFILSLGYASYVFFGGKNTVSNENIDVSILGNNFTAGGEELPLIVEIANKNSSALDSVDMVVEYPKSSSVLGTNTTTGVERLRISLGTIPAGAIRNENLKLVFFGEQGSVRPVTISIEYRVEGSNGIFVKSKSYEVTITSTPLNLSVDAPDVTSPNQDVTLNMKVALNATHPVSKILLKVDYPLGFKFTSSTPAPSLGNNVWNLGDLSPGAERKISVTGKMIDVVDGEEKTFLISSGSQSTTDKSMIDVVFNSLSHVVSVKKPFIEAQLFVNGVSDREYAINSRGQVSGEIRWVNNLDTKVNDLSIRAKISGNAANHRTINTDGFYDSLIDTIIWDKNSKTDFKEINPGETGSVGFSIAPISLYSSSDGMLVDPVIKINISVSGKQVVSGYETTELNNFDEGVIRVISDIGLTGKILYYSGPFTNTGDIPPKVDKSTSYTIVWSVSNTANNVSKAVVRSSIPVWVKFMGTVSPAGEDLSYSPSTREIVWNVGRIPKGAGITGAERSVAFQVMFTPSLSQLNATPVILNESILTGHDDFANVDLRANKAALRTTIDDSPSFSNKSGVVVE